MLAPRLWHSYPQEASGRAEQSVAWDTGGRIITLGGLDRYRPVPRHSGMGNRRDGRNGERENGARVTVPWINVNTGYGHVLLNILLRSVTRRLTSDEVSVARLRQEGYVE